MSFVDARSAGARVPINGPVARAYGAALGGAQDDEMALLRFAGLLRDPTRAPDEALDDVGSGYGIARYPGESHTSYRARLLIAFDTRRKSGTPGAVEMQTRAYGVPDVRGLTRAYDGHIYAGDYPLGRVDLGHDFGTTGIGPSLLGVNTPLGGFLLGSTATVQQRTTLKRLAWRWKDARGVVPYVMLNFGAGSLLGVNTPLGGFLLGGGTRSYWKIQPLFGISTVLGGFRLNEVNLT